MSRPPASNSVIVGYEVTNLLNGHVSYFATEGQALEYEAQVQAANPQQTRNSIGFTVHADNVGGVANPSSPVTISSGTVFALTVTYSPDLPSRTTVEVDMDLTDSKGRVIGRTEIFFSIESKDDVSIKVGGKTTRSPTNEFQLKGIVFADSGQLKDTAIARLRITLTDRAAKRTGSTSLPAKLNSAREMIDRKMAASMWEGAREFLVP
jgi:hypothetical protein